MREVLTLARCASVPPRLAAIVAYRAFRSGLSLRTLRSADKRAELVRVRQQAAWEARKSGYSLWQIGRALNRDHSTIRYSIQRYEEERA